MPTSTVSKGKDLLIFFFLFEAKLEYTKNCGYKTAESLSTVRLFEEFVTTNPLFKLSNRLKKLGREVGFKTHWNYGDFHFYTANILAHNLHKLESITTLVKAGLSSDAWPIYRGVIESALDYDYLYKNPSKIKLYFEYSTYLDLKRIERRMATHPLTAEQNKQYENLKAEWKKVEKKFAQGNRTRLAWRDKHLSEIAKDAEQGH